MKTIELNEQERMAIDAYLSEHWITFYRIAQDFMTKDEIEILAQKLSSN